MNAALPATTKEETIMTLALHYDADISPSELDSKAFKAFRLQVLHVITKATHPLCTREIKAALGPACVERWLQDALDMLQPESIESVGLLPTRYTVATQAVGRIKRVDDRRRRHEFSLS